MQNFILSENENTEINSKLDKILLWIEQFEKQDKELLTTDQLLKHVPVSRRTLQNYRDRKIIRFHRVGRKILYSLYEVKQDLAKVGNSALVAINM